MRAKPEMKPWVHADKSGMSSVGAALQREHLPYVSEVPPLWGSINVLTIITQGLRPGLCSSIALTGLLYVFQISILYYFDALALLTGVGGSLQGRHYSI